MDSKLAYSEPVAAKLADIGRTKLRKEIKSGRLTARKPLGLYAFLYASLHLLNFIGIDYGFSLRAFLDDALLQKRFMIVGFSAFLILLPLAITSTKGWMKRLGRNWKRLHQLVYLALGDRMRAEIHALSMRTFTPEGWTQAAMK